MNNQLDSIVIGEYQLNEVGKLDKEIRLLTLETLFSNDKDKKNKLNSLIKKRNKIVVECEKARMRYRYER